MFLGRYRGFWSSFVITIPSEAFLALDTSEKRRAIFGSFTSDSGQHHNFSE